MFDHQFYPTPKSLGIKAWSLFKNRSFSRVLEPSAGYGDLAVLLPGSQFTRQTVDCIEIDMAKHSRLRDLKFTVVGLDFMEFGGGAHYSHIIMNPPFAYGARHTLKAWDILWDGEIVSIINAESIRNPYCRDRQRLVQLIEQHGSVEFVQSAFMTADTQRKTEVEIALIYLRKKADTSEFTSDMLETLSMDTTSADDMADFDKEAHDIALPRSVIENMVLNFNAAAKASREAVLAEARAKRYSSRLGEPLSESIKEAGEQADLARYVRDENFCRYLALKERAWNAVLKSTEVTSRTSRKVQADIESQFQTVTNLEFTVSNIYSFLQGLSADFGAS